MRTPIRIDTADDPRIDAYTRIRERDLVGHGGRFIAEGETVLAVLLRQKLHRVESLFILDKRLPLLEEQLAALPDDVPVYTAAREIMDAVAGFPIHRGVLAVGVRGASPDPAMLLERFPIRWNHLIDQNSLKTKNRRAFADPIRSANALSQLPERALIVGLVGLANHDNVGGIFRNAAAFGAAAVLLDDASCDPLYRKAIRVSVGGCLTVPFCRVTTALDMVNLLEEAGFTVLALSPRGTETLASLKPPPRTALILGAEGPGLPDEVLARCRTVSIPMAGAFDSLNVATTSGIALHHLVSA